jgi:hypothetical protein
MRRLALSLAACLLAAPAGAQQYWLPNGSGGTTFNNPQGSLLGTANERMLQRHMQQRQMGGGGPAQATPSPSAGRMAAARSADPSFRLNNTGRRVVREVYVSAATDGAWGPDRLGMEVLQPGSRLVVRLPMGECVNDIRVVFMDGEAQERRGVDTCGLTDIPVQ